MINHFPEQSYLHVEDSRYKPSNYQLYEPLKVALQDSNVFNNYHHYNIEKTLVKSKSKSLLASNIKSFRPEEAQKIKRNLFIPINQELVATNNLQKIRGINFSIIDCQEKVGNAISEQEFKKRMATKRREIVYQLQANNNYLASSQVVNQYSSYSNRPFQAYQEKNQYNLAERGEGKEYKANQVNPQEISSKKQANITQGPSLNYQKIKDEETDDRNIGKKPYHFKRQLLHYESGNKQEKLKRQRYNLFSMIDLGGNQDCSKAGCCGTNEIIASKLNANNWD